MGDSRELSIVNGQLSIVNEEGDAGKVRKRILSRGRGAKCLVLSVFLNFFGRVWCYVKGVEMRGVVLIDINCKKPGQYRTEMAGFWRVLAWCGLF